MQLPQKNVLLHDYTEEENDEKAISSLKALFYQKEVYKDAFVIF